MFESGYCCVVVGGFLLAYDVFQTVSFYEYFPPTQASFQRANVLMSMERYQDALEELEIVRNNVPKESAVYFLMGKVKPLLPPSLPFSGLGKALENMPQERTWGSLIVV